MWWCSLNHLLLEGMRVNCHFKFCWLLVGSLLLFSCASGPAVPVADVTMPGASVFHKHGLHVASDFELGLHWQAIAPDYIALTATAGQAIRIFEQAGLQLDIDGETFYFSTERHKEGVLTRFFVVRLALVKRMLLAAQVKITLNTSEGPLYGELKLDRSRSAIRGFRETLLRIEAIRSSR